MPRADRSSYTTLDFFSWKETATLEISPKFQRRSMWNTPARTRTIREVIDGQQRLRAVLEFIEDKYSLTKSVSREFGGKRFSQLPIDTQELIRNYSFICEVFQSISDFEVLEIFSRLNTYSVSLNKQELRNGRYFGLFKQTAYELAHEHLQFWRVNNIFTEGKIARMDEVELTSEVIIALIAGLQDTKSTIDQFYSVYDDDFPEQEKVSDSFRAIIDNVTESLDQNDFQDSEFKRTPLFYTLCCVVAHRLFGLPKENLETPRKGNLIKKEKQGLNEAVRVLSEKFQTFKDKELPPGKYFDFVLATKNQAANIAPRRKRFEVLYSEAFL